MDFQTMSDLELVNLYCEQCLEFIDPRIFREVSHRGLLFALDDLPKKKHEAKAVAYGRLLKRKRVFNDAEIDYISGLIFRQESLKKQLAITDVTECHRIRMLLEKMQAINFEMVEYFKN
jgi:hypothetical protein